MLANLAASSRTRRLISACLAIVVGCLGTAYAQDGLVAAPLDYTNTLTAFQTAAALWNPALKNVATTTFWSLAFIEFAWMAMMLAVKGADLGDIAWEMIKMIMFLGFFWELVLAGPAWSNAVIQSFQQAGDMAVAASGGTTSMNPSSILAEGLKTALTIMQTPGVWNPITALGLEIGALIVLICFAYIAGYYAVTLVESYIVIGASIMFYAFGGSRWTVDTARRVFMYSVSVGAKLFVLELISGTTYVLMQGWVAAYQNNNSSMFGLIALALTVAVVTAMLPGLIQSVVSGASSAGPSEAMSIGGMAMGATAGIATAGLGVAAASSAAHSLAKVQSAGSAMSGGAGSPRSGVGDSGDSVAADVGSMVNGMPGSGSGSGGSIEPASNLGGPMSGRSAGSGSTAKASAAPNASVKPASAANGGGEAPDRGSAFGVGERSAGYHAAREVGPTAQADDGTADDIADASQPSSATGSAITADSGSNPGGDGSADESGPAKGSAHQETDAPTAAGSGGESAQSSSAEPSATEPSNSDDSGTEAAGTAPSLVSPSRPSYAAAFARNLASAAGQEIKAHLSGQRRYTQTRHSGFRMAEGMKEQLAELQKPMPPDSSSAGSTAPPDAPRAYPPNVDQPAADKTDEKPDAG